MRGLSSKLSVAALLLTAASAAFAGVTPPSSVPEPGLLELLGIGAAAAVAIALRKRKQPCTPRPPRSPS